MIGWREIGGRRNWRSLGKMRKNYGRRKMIGEERGWRVKIGDRKEGIGGGRRGDGGGVILGD